LFLTYLAIAGAVSAQQAAAPGPNLSDPNHATLYVVGYAHLDTEWRWEYPQTISEFLPKTLHNNFALFEKYPHYIFNFSGANRYRMIKEYYPADYLKLRGYVAAGRWFPAGSSMEEGDVNSPSAESIIRQVLYGNNWFRREFGKASAEFMLPDCFGFPASLPSILSHAGVRGFSTQKLTWGSSAPAGGPDSPEKTPRGTPFNVGLWFGPDGKSVIAALNPGDYSGSITEDLSKSPGSPADPNARKNPIDWPARVQRNGQVSGVFADYHYYGTGDTGGSPNEASVRLMEGIQTGSLTKPTPDINLGMNKFNRSTEKVNAPRLNVISATADQMFLDIKPNQISRLPRYSGDMELTNHSAGSLTSEAYQKRWNRKNELLADAAEKASIAAEWLGGRPYPLKRLNDAWTLVMGGHFHDIMAGTATPKSYEYAWNDQVLAMNQFAGVLTSATEAVASGMNTQAKGTAVVVYNPLSVQREDVVEANISFANGSPKSVRVFGPDGKETPAQIAGAKILFLAKSRAAGFSVYDVQPAGSSDSTSSLKVDESSLENARYLVKLDRNGDVSSIFDKNVQKELLAAPVRLALQTEKPHDWPAWNMDWTDQQKPPRAFVDGPAKIRVVERGPVRVAIEVERESEGSRYVQTIRLSAGDAGNRVEFSNVIDWKTSAAALKATFPLTASNPEATYNWDIGTIKRGNNDEQKFEVPSHQWFDLTDKSGTYGVTVLSDCKYGSDKPDDSTLRLTLIYTPGIGEGNGKSYGDQTTQDWGNHEFVFGLAGHSGDWRQAQTDWQAQRLNQPLIAFETASHQGALGKEFSLLNVNNSRVRVLALKKAEESDEVIVRLVELDGRPQHDVRIGFAAPILAAREVNGQEQPVGQASVRGGVLDTEFGPYQPRTFALKVARSRVKVAGPYSQAVNLPYNISVASVDNKKSCGTFDAAGNSLPAEMLPLDISYSGIQFKLAPSGKCAPNAVAAQGQEIALPTRPVKRIYILAAADGEQNGTFRVGDKIVDLRIDDWGGFIGQWDTRVWQQRSEAMPARPGAPVQPPGTTPRMRTSMVYSGLSPAFIKRAPVAWFASHHHTAEGVNVPYGYSYLFAYTLDVPANAKTVTLPNNDKIRILAITASDEGQRFSSAEPLYDVFERGDR